MKISHPQIKKNNLLSFFFTKLGGYSLSNRGDLRSKREVK